MRPATLRLRSALVAIAACGAATSARAEGGGYVIPGVLATPVWGHVPAMAWGGEVSWMHYASIDSKVGFGAFAQAQAYSGDEPTHSRFAFGGQVGSFVGAELGMAVRGGNGIHAWTTGIQMTPYASIGIFTVGARFVLPIAHGAGEGYGFETGLVLALKGPIPYGKPPPDFGSGRALSVAGRARVATLVRRRDSGSPRGARGDWATRESRSRGEDRAPRGCVAR